ncbi:hypothetical protein RF11_03638 [Thelohanellus kitauei]|uniref:ISXO2-like transposase domain-containing protein n=1 Tax=Thelohanellus kitauei TaxID=669202 RepID=A0A0C2NFK5_THEKT|nr:hypothetical protein RF11_03638 [Thelohanellus kitauei]
MHIFALVVQKIISNKDCSDIKAHCETLRRTLSNACKNNFRFDKYANWRPGVVVEIDQCNLGKNNHRGWHLVSGTCVLGVVKPRRERQLFLIEVPHRTANSLTSVITSHVLEGSTIITDCCRRYKFGLSL